MSAGNSLTMSAPKISACICSHISFFAPPPIETSEVMLQPAAVKFNDVYAQLAQLGLATGHKPKATALVARMKSQIAQIVASVPKRLSRPWLESRGLDQ